MQILTISPNGPRPASIAAGYPMQVRSWLGALCFHALLVGGVSQIKFVESPAKLDFAELIRRHEQTELIFHPPKKPVPAATDKRIGKTVAPQAKEKAPRTFIAVAPNPKSVQLTVWKPIPLPELKTDVPAPNVVARIESALPPPPPKPKPKQFVPPPPSKTEPKLALRTELADTPAPPPVAASGAGTTPTIALSAKLPGPPQELPPAPTPSPGNAKADIAIASVNPAPTAAPPQGVRSGQVTKAPEVGELSTGAPAPGALTVPNLTVIEPPKPPLAPKPPAPKGNVVIYAEKVRASTTATFTIPLRPANRSIPRAVDVRFAGRSVYTVVVPIENLPAYGGDWIMWFGETAAEPAGQTPLMRAPVPLRKNETVEASRDAKDTRLQIAAKLGVDGKFHDVKMLSAAAQDIQDLALEDLTSWEMKPATRNGAPIEIETVLEIPFRLPLRH